MTSASGWLLHFLNLYSKTSQHKISYYLLATVCIYYKQHTWADCWCCIMWKWNIVAFLSCLFIAVDCVDQYIHLFRTLIFWFYSRKYHLVGMIWLDCYLFKLTAGRERERSTAGWAILIFNMWLTVLLVHKLAST